MKRLAFYEACTFFEPFVNHRGKNIKVNFQIPRDEETREPLGRYINAIDLMIVLNFKDPYKTWETLKKKHKLEIEWWTSCYIEDKEIREEEFVNLDQFATIMNSLRRLTIEETFRLIEFINGALDLAS